MRSNNPEDCMKLSQNFYISFVQLLHPNESIVYTTSDFFSQKYQSLNLSQKYDSKFKKARIKLRRHFNNHSVRVLFPKNFRSVEIVFPNLTFSEKYLALVYIL